MKRNRSYTWKVIGVALMTFGTVTLIMAGMSSAYAMAYIITALIGLYTYICAFYWAKFEQRQISYKQLLGRSYFICLLLFVVGLAVYRARNIVLNGGILSDYWPQFLSILILIFTATLFFQRNTKAEPSQIGKPITTENLKTEYLNHDKRRYTMVIEGIEKEENTTRVKGIIHGEIHLNDEIVILHPNKEGVHAIVKQIDDAGTTSKKDAPVTLVLDTDDFEQFSVISSYMPSQMPQGPQENPLLAGLTYEYGKNRTNHAFLSIYINTLIHSKFLVPVLMDHSPRNVNGNMEFTQDTKVGFMAVNRTDQGETTKTFALFTDAHALRKWRDLFKNGKRPKTLTITFQDAVQIMWKGHQGIVLNPFGPIYVYLSAELIDTITKQESYQKEFGAPGEKGLSFDRNRKN